MLIIKPFSQTPQRRRVHQSGLSIVELLVGVAISLLLLTGIVTLFVDYLNSNRVRLVEARITQDLRVAADLIARDLRRAGYWGNSTGGAVTTITSPTAASSPYAAVSPSGAASASTVTYSYSQGTENNALDSAEQFGFRLNSGVIQYQQGSGNWQPITDINSMTVTGFTVQPNVTQVSLAQYCTGGTCTGGGCPFMNMRRYDITINAASPDGTITRQLQETVRVRNDQFTGACP